MREHDRGQVAASAAEIYEEFFVPALFAEWPARLLEAAGTRPGDRVLDVACGTGILAREAARLVGPGGSVTGVDVNRGMLAVARSNDPAIDWKTGAAEALPFESGSFDRVLCQFGLMFFDDPTEALREMWRVTRPGGTMGVAVWASLEETPGYAAMAGVLHELFGPEVARSIEVPYALGDPGKIRASFRDAGLDDIKFRTMEGEANFPSIGEWIHTDIKGWTLADVIDDEGYERLRREAPAKLSRLVRSDGSVRFAAPAHLVTVTV